MQGVGVVPLAQRPPWFLESHWLRGHSTSLMKLNKIDKLQPLPGCLCFQSYSFLCPSGLSINCGQKHMEKLRLVHGSITGLS